MSQPGGCGQANFSGPDAIEALLVARLRVLLLPEVIQAVREEIARQGASQAVPDKREWLSQPAAAQIGGVSVSTIRAWQKSGRLSKGERGRVSAAELRAVLAGRKPGASACGVVDAEFARITAARNGGVR